MLERVSLSSTMATGVKWLSEAFWIPRQPISLRAGRDVGRSLGLNNVQHEHYGAFWMVNCRQDDKPSRVGPARLSTLSKTENDDHPIFAICCQTGL